MILLQHVQRPLIEPYIDIIVSINSRVRQIACGRGPCTQSNMSEAGNTEELNLGCDEAGEDCFGKVITYGGKSAIAGGCVKMPGVLYLDAYCGLYCTGGLVGSAEGCFLSPVPNSTTPMLVRALGLIARRSMLFGKQNVQLLYYLLPCIVVDIYFYMVL